MDSTTAHKTLTAALAAIEQNRVDEADRMVSQVLTSKPKMTDALQVKAMVQRARGEHQKAQKTLLKGHKLNPNAPGIASLLGLILAEGFQYEKAIKVLDRCVAAKPDFAVGRYNRSIALLAIGRFEEGFKDFETRFQGALAVKDNSLGLPRWTGEGGHVLIWDELGLGDQILFVQFIDEARRRADRVTLLTDRRLVSVFARSLNGVDVRASEDQNKLIPGPDSQIPIASLPVVLHAKPGINPPQGYLKADPARAAAFRQLFEQEAEGRPIAGVSWHSVSSAVGRNKSVAPDLFATLWRDQPAFLVNLQYFQPPGDAARFAGALNADSTLFDVPNLDVTDDLDGVFAAIAALDIVVTVSNTVAHIAAAQGVPVLLLLTEGAGTLWYWAPDADATPWYPNVTRVLESRSGGRSAMLRDAARLFARLTT